MSDGSTQPSVAAAVLFAAAILFAAATVPALASYSPIGGLSGVDEALPAQNASTTGAAGGAGATGGAGGAPGSAGSGLPLSPAGGPPLGLDGAEGGPGVAAPDGLFALFEPFLQWFAGGTSAGASGGEAAAGGSSGDGGGESDGSIDGGSGPTDGGGQATPQQPDATPAGADGGSGDGDDPAITDRAGVLGAAVLGGLALALAAYLYRSDRGVVSAIAALPSVVRRLLLAAFLAVSEAVENLLRLVVEAPSPLAVPGALLAALVASLRSSGGEVVAALPGLGGDDGDAPTSATDGTEPERPARERIRETWKLVVDAVTVGNYRTRTPGEVEAAAIDDGLPPAEVSTLADSFRDVEYGAETPSERVETATSAAATIREHLADEGADDGGDA